MCFLADFGLPIGCKSQLKTTNILLTLQINNLDWYESWAEDFRETELDFVLLDIHKPKLQTYNFLGSKAHDTSYHKKGKICYKKRSIHHKPAWDVRGKEMCIKKAKRRYTLLKS